MYLLSSRQDLKKISYAKLRVSRSVNFTLQLLSCYLTNFDQTLKAGFWDHLYQMPYVRVNFFMYPTFFTKFCGGHFLLKILLDTNFFTQNVFDLYLGNTKVLCYWKDFTRVLDGKVNLLPFNISGDISKEERMHICWKLWSRS